MAFHTAPTLEHARVRLEQLRPEHAADLAEAAAADGLHRLWQTVIPAPEALPAEIERRLELQRAGRMAPFAIIEPEHGRAVGMTTFMNLEPEHRRLEIGSTWLAKRLHGSAINPAAKLLLLERAFEALDCIAVEFRTHWHNRQSRRAIEALGAKQDGVLRSHQIGPDGLLRDTVVFSIVAAEWPTVRRGLQFRLDA